MKRRAVAIAILIVWLLAWPVAADTEGARRQAQHDRRCATAGPIFPARAVKMGCIVVDGRWMSGRIWSA